MLHNYMNRIVSIFFVFSLTLLLISCGKSGHDEHHDHAASDPEDDENGALYEEVMKLHDEGMARMDEIYKLKKELTDKIASAPDLVEEKRKAIERKISSLDSASRGMMQWMRSFHPETDSLDDEGYRKYLESEMEKVKKVKDDIMDAIARAKEE